MGLICANGRGRWTGQSRGTCICAVRFQGIPRLTSCIIEDMPVLQLKVGPTRAEDLIPLFAQLTARITGEALKCFDGIPEADQARAAPLRDKLMALYQEQQAAEEEKQRQKELKQQKREQREQREQMAQQASGISPSPEPQAEAPAPKPWYAVILEAPAAIAQRFKDRI